MASNNFLLIIVLIILLVIVAIFFDSISGLVTSYTAAGVDSINPSILEFDRYDSSKVVNIVVDTGSDMVNRNFVLKSINGEVQLGGTLCDGNVCEGKISNNFIVSRNIDTGEYYFEFDRVCKPRHTECESLNKKIRSGMLKILHV